MSAVTADALIRALAQVRPGSCGNPPNVQDIAIQFGFRLPRFIVKLYRSNDTVDYLDLDRDEFERIYNLAESLTAQRIAHVV